MTGGQDSGEFGTFAVYDFKKTVLIHYGNAYNAMTNHVLKNNSNTEKYARKCLTLLLYSVYDKIYILRDREATNYLAYFMINPDKFKLFGLQTVFLILQRLLNRMGLTRFEEFRLSAHKAYMENDS
jgi:hypothetical protein